MKTNLYLLIGSLFILNVSLAQDYHFSQFDAIPFYINPALTGERLTDYKGAQFNANYRDQFAQYTRFPGTYRSVAVGADEIINSKFSTGQYVYNDQSATGSFNTFGFLVSGAHKIVDVSAENKTSHNLSIGVQLGFLNKSINPQKFTYDQQYSTSSADGFDRSIPSGESFARQSYYNFNVNFGVYYRMTTKNKKVSAFGGFSIYNISEPNQSFLTGSGYTALPLRFNLHGGAIIKASKLLTIMPQFLYMNQAKATEFDMSTLMFYKIEGSPYETIYGLGFRNKNAIIFQGGVRYKGITYRMSYDLITHYLQAYRNSAIEFTLVYTLKGKANTGKKNETPPSDAGQIIAPQQ